MTKAEQFRKAEETEAKAEAAYEEHVKQAYREIARYWREPVEEAETSSRPKWRPQRENFTGVNVGRRKGAIFGAEPQLPVYPRLRTCRCIALNDAKCQKVMENEATNAALEADAGWRTTL